MLCISGIEVILCFIRRDTESTSIAKHWPTSRACRDGRNACFKMQQQKQSTGMGKAGRQQGHEHRSCSGSIKKTPTDGLGMAVPARLWNTTLLSRFATNTRWLHSGRPRCWALCDIYGQNSCFLKNLHQNHQDFIEEKLGSSVEHLRNIFPLANAILKLLTEETGETHWKKPHRPFKHISRVYLS